MLHLGVPSHQPDLLSWFLEEDGFLQLGQEEHNLAITNEASVLPLLVVDSPFSREAIHRETNRPQAEPSHVEGKDAGLC